MPPRQRYIRSKDDTKWLTRAVQAPVTSTAADPSGRNLPRKFYTDFRDGYLPDVFEPLGGGKPLGHGGNAYLQYDGSTNPYNKEMQWMRPTNVRVQPSIYDSAEGNVLALITRNDGYTTTHVGNRTDPQFDYLVTHQNARAGRDAAGNPMFPYTSGMVATQGPRHTAGQVLTVDNTKEWTASSRMRWPNLPGYWPGWWMLPDPITLGWISERDLMEDFGNAAPDGQLADSNIVWCNLFNNGQQLPYNNHKRRSLALGQYHTWVARNDPTGSQAAGHVGKRRHRVYVDGNLFFDSDFYRTTYTNYNIDDWLYTGNMHFIYQGAQIGGTGSNGGRLQTDPYWRDLGPQALAALPITMEVAHFGVWEAGATEVASVPVVGHPTTPALGA